VVKAFANSPVYLMEATETRVSVSAHVVLKHGGVGLAQVDNHQPIDDLGL
jgi:hypothetical protein